jgi:integrase
MPAIKFTSRWVRSVKPPTHTDRIDYFDYSYFNKGQALVLRVRRSGTKSWCVVYIKNGKNRPPYTLGRYPALSLADAAETGAQILGQLLTNVDPVQARNERAADPDFEQIAELFLLRYCAHKKDSGRRDREILTRDFITLWGSEKAQDIRRRDVVAVLDRIADRGPVAANRALACIRKLFNWAIQRDLLETNPATNIPHNRETTRDRVLSVDEIKTLWPAIEAADMAEGIRLLLQLMLVTGQRKAEWLVAEWSEFDLTGGWWTIPAEHAKNGQSHRVPLSPLALKLLTNARQASDRSDLVLPSPRTGKPMAGGAVDRAVRNNRDRFPMQHWTPHDLRRSAASHWGRLEVPRLIIKKLLNHTDSDITAVYDRHSYDKEKKAALDTWGRELQQLVGGAV